MMETYDYYDDEGEREMSSKERKEWERKKAKNKKKLESRKKNKKTNKENDQIVKEEVKEDGMETDENIMPQQEKDDFLTEPDIEGDSIDKEHFEKVFARFQYNPDDSSLSDGLHLKHEYTSNVIGVDHADRSEEILQEEIDTKKKELQESGDMQSLSRKKLRKSLQPSIASLKQSTSRPDVVEWSDVTSRDPFLLVHLKSYRNTVPVPPHWNAKRKYLAGKRGFERAPFELPDCIKKTGIMEMRETMWEKEGNQSLKSKMKERTRPKLGRINIDYQDLHDAFFKWQTKPKLTVMGDLYYEGKELDAKMFDKKPGKLSDELRLALGMPIGNQSHKFPPPWLIAMQRYGPPPSYPNLKIPGLNSPIPDGCMFGYHPGGWGKPPVDEMGKPCYGDVFGLETPLITETEDDRNIDRRRWGEFDQNYVDEEEVPEEEDDENDMDIEENENIVIGDAELPSGISSVATTGLETPRNIELRKTRGAESTISTMSETPAGPLYTIIPERKSDNISNQMMGSTKTYDMSSRIGGETFEMSLNPEDLDIAEDGKKLTKKYEEQLRKENTKKGWKEGEDVSDMLSEHVSKSRKRKVEEKKGGKGSSSGTKKSKDFKF